MLLLKKIKIVCAFMLAALLAGLALALKNARQSAQRAENALDNVRAGQKSERGVRQALDYAEEKKKKVPFKPKEDRSDFEGQW